jgi:hypothetical protein
MEDPSEGCFEKCDCTASATGHGIATNARAPAAIPVRANQRLKKVWRLLYWITKTRIAVAPRARRAMESVTHSTPPSQRGTGWDSSIMLNTAANKIN